MKSSFSTLSIHRPAPLLIQSFELLIDKLWNQENLISEADGKRAATYLNAIEQIKKEVYDGMLCSHPPSPIFFEQLQSFLANWNSLLSLSSLKNKKTNKALDNLLSIVANDIKNIEESSLRKESEPNPTHSFVDYVKEKESARNRLMRLKQEMREIFVDFVQPPATKKDGIVTILTDEQEWLTGDRVPNLYNSLSKLKEKCIRLLECQGRADQIKKFTEIFDQQCAAVQQSRTHAHV